MLRFLKSLATRSRARANSRHRVNLALQGGGALGAFTWGVIDRLLEEDLEIVAVSGASAGAMNAGALATGLTRGGKAEARAVLDAFWQDIARKDALPHVNDQNLSLSGQWMQGWTNFFQSAFAPKSHLAASLGATIDRHIDCDLLREQSKVKLLISATNMRTEKPHLFNETTISRDVLLASAALPMIHEPVEIAGVPYVDGGLSLNPPLTALLDVSEAEETLLIRLMPFGSDTMAAGPFAMMAQNVQMSFNRGLIAELEHWQNLANIAASGRKAAHPTLERIATHHLTHIDGSAHMPDGAFNKALDPNPQFVTDLFERGRNAAANWLSHDRGGEN